MTTQLESLRRWSVIVADTGDLAAIERFRPRDATTNPSLILKAAREPRHREIVDEALGETAAIEFCGRGFALSSSRFSEAASRRCPARELRHGDRFRVGRQHFQFCLSVREQER